MSTKLQRHFNATLESIEDETVSFESVGAVAVIGGLLIAGDLVLKAWGQYSEWRKKKLKDSSDPDVRKRELAFNSRLVIKNTSERIKKTYLDPKWVGKQELHSGQIDASNILPYLSSKSSVTVAEVGNEFKKSIAAANQYISQVSKVVGDYHSFMNSKIIPLVDKATDSNAEYIAADIEKLAKSVKFSNTQITSLPVMIGHSKWQGKDRLRYVGVEKSNAQLPALDAEGIVEAGKILLSVTDAIEQLYSKEPQGSYDWDDVEIPEELRDALIGNGASDLWFNSSAAGDQHRYYVSGEVIDALIESAIALERWIYRSLK